MSEMQGIELPSDGTLSETVFNDFIWELSNGTLVAQSYGMYNTHEHRVRITNKLTHDSLVHIVDMSWEQWEDLVEAIRERAPQKIVETQESVYLEEKDYEPIRFRGGLSL